MLKTQLFSERLRQLRTDKNMSVKELGELCGTSGATISRYETGVHEPKSNMVKKLAEIFDISPAWLMGANVEKKGQDIISYDDPNIFSHLPKDLKDFVSNSKNTPYLIMAKNIAAYDLSKLTENEMRFFIDWLKMAIKETNNNY